MKQNKADYILLSLSIGGFLLLAISFPLMPLETMGIIPGMLFWSGLSIGVVCQIVLEARRRALLAKYKVKRETMQKPRNGFLSFCSNRIAMVADMILVISAIVTVAVFVITKGAGYLCYVSLAVLVFSLCLHCIFNGRNYVFIKNQTKVRKVLEQKEVNSIDKGERKK